MPLPPRALLCGGVSAARASRQRGCAPGAGSDTPLKISPQTRAEPPSPTFVPRGWVRRLRRCRARCGARRLKRCRVEAALPLASAGLLSLARPPARRAELRPLGRACSSGGPRLLSPAERALSARQLPRARRIPDPVVKRGRGAPGAPQPALMAWVTALVRSQVRRSVFGLAATCKVQGSETAEAHGLLGIVSEGR